MSNVDRIDACYDSHVHWAATGEFAERVRLESLGAAKEVLNLSKDHLYCRQDWILGFGWDDSKWSDRNDLHRRILDQWSPDKPVLFTRVDGHVGWVNTLALKKAGWIGDDNKLRVDTPSGGRIEVTGNGDPTGVLVDKAYEKFLNLVPKATGSEVRRHLLKATQIFHNEGFTHIRDVGGNEQQWQQALLLDRAQLLNLAVEMFFHLEEPNHLEALAEFVVAAKAEAATNLRPQGIKIFLDGALGSEGAWISRPYASGSGQGLQVLTAKEIEAVFRTVWGKNLEVAVHTIGDAAVHQVIEIAHRLKESSVSGRLHLEHAEIVRPDTLEMMKGLDVVCHLQPCHWLSDHKWLKDKVGEELYRCSFPWRRMQQSEIGFDFGSDSPGRTAERSAHSSGSSGIGDVRHPEVAWSS